MFVLTFPYKFNLFILRMGRDSARTTASDGPIVHPPDDGWKRNVGGIVSGKVKHNYWRQILSHFHFYQHRSHTEYPGIIQRLCHEKPKAYQWQG
jgi:hypothetical protein